MGGYYLLVGNEDLERAHNLSKRDGFVCLPGLGGLGIVDEDDEVFGIALEVDLGLGYFSASHDCGLYEVVVWGG